MFPSAPLYAYTYIHSHQSICICTCGYYVCGCNEAWLKCFALVHTVLMLKIRIYIPVGYGGQKNTASAYVSRSTLSTLNSVSSCANAAKRMLPIFWLVGKSTGKYGYNNMQQITWSLVANSHCYRIHIGNATVKMLTYVTAQWDSVFGLHFKWSNPLMYGHVCARIVLKQ